jgi:hypothetical protein
VAIDQPEIVEPTSQSPEAAEQSGAELEPLSWAPDKQQSQVPSGSQAISSPTLPRLSADPTNDLPVAPKPVAIIGQEIKSLSVPKTVIRPPVTQTLSSVQTVSNTHDTVPVPSARGPPLPSSSVPSTSAQKPKTHDSDRAPNRRYSQIAPQAVGTPETITLSSDVFPAAIQLWMKSAPPDSWLLLPEPAGAYHKTVLNKIKRVLPGQEVTSFESFKPSTTFFALRPLPDGTVTHYLLGPSYGTSLWPSPYQPHSVPTTSYTSVGQGHAPSQYKGPQVVQSVQPTSNVSQNSVGVTVAGQQGPRIVPRPPVRADPTTLARDVLRALGDSWKRKRSPDESLAMGEGPPKKLSIVPTMLGEAGVGPVVMTRKTRPPSPQAPDIAGPTPPDGEHHASVLASSAGAPGDAKGHLPPEKPAPPDAAQVNPHEQSARRLDIAMPQPSPTPQFPLFAHPSPIEEVSPQHGHVEVQEPKNPSTPPPSTQPPAHQQVQEPGATKTPLFLPSTPPPPTQPPAHQRAQEPGATKTPLFLPSPSSSPDIPRVGTADITPLSLPGARQSPVTALEDENLFIEADDTQPSKKRGRQVKEVYVLVPPAPYDTRTGQTLGQKPEVKKRRSRAVDVVQKQPATRQKETGKNPSLQ